MVIESHFTVSSIYRISIFPVDMVNMGDECIIVAFYSCELQLNFILQNNLRVKSSAIRKSYILIHSISRLTELFCDFVYSSNYFFNCLNGCLKITF
jgi:hypothetical protein